ncbi:MAG: undecaprenyl/decaprenyl-phosphate alpha-N-acetylglucosaminyl 1-phosphate transferase [Phycisphaeraceae bacterium]|nr:undecaprenyl/decaprenyl-phosphate alpha-N-acetylglucosaminyl 1-phosphate transferase [Phycisphaeraceae bacterium]
MIPSPLPTILQSPGVTGAAKHALPASEPVRQRISQLSGEVERLSEQVQELAAAAGLSEHTVTRLDIFHGYIGVFIAAFVITLLVTPLMRVMAIHHGIVDRPSESRKAHRMPVAYLGGVAVYLGLLAGIVFAYTAPLHGLIDFHPSAKTQTGFAGGVPLSVLLGMTVIMICGLIDDVVGIDPRAKIAGQLFAAAALATQDVGVKVAAGVIVPLAKQLGLPTTIAGGFETLAFTIDLGVAVIPIDVVYWVGTAIIAIFVLGACNASNLIDGLDGLLSGVTAIATGGLLVIALTLALIDDGARSVGPGFDAPRIVLCMALLGACLGFLPHNFNPATIFLGDCGSLLMGFITIVIVLSLGDTGRTHLVLAGLIIYAIPIIDTTLAIARRKISGKKISDADDQHLHHMLKRSLGVRGAVLALYAIGVAFAVFGVLLSEERGRVTYALVLVFAAFIGVTSFKVARRDAIERQVLRAESRRKIQPGAADQSAVSGPPQTSKLSADEPAQAEHLGQGEPTAPAKSATQAAREGA